MSTLFFDTETTGLPKSYKITPNDTSDWDSARLIELGYIISDKYGNVLEKKSYLIKPTGTFNISAENQKIHGYSEQDILNKGINIKEMLRSLKNDIDKFNVNKFVAHNYNFDSNVLRSEICRMKDVNDFANIFNKQHYCTMESGTNITKLPNIYGYKWPSLSELCHHYNISFDENKAHKALYDTTKTFECYNKMVPPTSQPICDGSDSSDEDPDYAVAAAEEDMRTWFNSHSSRSNEIEECPFCGIRNCHCGSGY